MKKYYLVIALIFVSPRFGEAANNGWNEYKTLHIIIYYKNVPLDFVKTVEQFAENDYQEIAENLGFTRDKSWRLDERAKIYIYDDADGYVQNAQQAHWSSGAASPETRMIQTFPSAAGFFDSTLPHELGHIIFHEFVGKGADVPEWFDEGVAMFQEKAKRWGVNKYVKECMENKRFIPLSSLHTMRLYRDSDPKIVEVFYAESASLVYYMIMELGSYRFVKLCHQLKDGMSFGRALESAYGRFKDLDDLSRAWMSYLEQSN